MGLAMGIGGGVSAAKYEGVKMVTCLFIEIHMVSIALFVYVYLVSRRQSISERFARSIRLFVGVGTLSSLSGIIAGLIKISAWGRNHIVLDIALIICFLSLVQLGYLWMLLAGVIQNSKLVRSRRFLLITYIPTAVVVLLICTTPRTKLIFYHTSQGELCIGPLFWVVFVLKYGYYLFVAVRATMDGMRATDIVVQRRCRAITKCMLFPPVFDLLLPFSEGMYISNIGIALACGYIGVNLYSHVLEQSPVWKKMMDAVGCGFININMGTNQIVSYNRYAAEIMECPDMMVGQEMHIKEYLLEHQAEDDTTDIRKEFDRLRAGEGKVSFFTKIKHKDGTLMPIRVSISHIEDVTGEKLYVYSLQDETEMREAMQRSAFTHNILLAIGNIYFCNYYIDIEKDTFVEISSLMFLSAHLGKEGKASETFDKWRRASVLTDYLEELGEFQQLDTLRERIGSATAISMDFQTKHIGWCRGLFIPVKRDESGLATHVLWVARDINEDMLRLEQSRKYLDLYNHDALTGLYNRYGFNECIEETIQGKPSGGLALLMLDIDHFKKVNDTYGHQNGDIVLRNVAERLRQYVAMDGVISRWGGEEFMVLLPSEQGAAELAERLRSGMEETEIEIADRRIHITVSVGACIVNRGAVITVDRLVYSTDKCLYAAKRAGRNCVVTEIISA